MRLHAASAVLGPLLTDTIAFGLSESLRNQTIGLEVVSRVLVAPLNVCAGVLTGHTLEPFGDSCPVKRGVTLRTSLGFGSAPNRTGAYPESTALRARSSVGCAVPTKEASANQWVVRWLTSHMNSRSASAYSVTRSPAPARNGCWAV